MKNLINKHMVLFGATLISANLLNANTLEEALLNGKFDGEIRSFSIFASKSDSKESGLLDNANASAIALQLNYETGDYKGFKIQLGAQKGHDFHIGNDAGSPLENEDEPRATAQGTNLYIANISYATGKTNIKVGRQLITTPLIVGSNTHPMRDSFAALAITNKDLPQTELRFYAISNWYQRYTAEFGNKRATKFHSPMYSLYLKNNSFEKLTLEAQALTTNQKGSTGDSPVPITDGYSVYFTSLDYKLPTTHPMSLGAFYAGATFDLKGEDDATMYGIKLGTKVLNTIVKLAYTKVTDDHSFPGALGHTPNFFKYNGGQMYTDNIYAGTGAASILLIPDFGIPGVKTLFSYSSYSQSDAGIKESGHNMDGASELQADLRYKFSGALKGLSLRLQSALIDYDDNTVDEDSLAVTRIYLNYKF